MSRRRLLAGLAALVLLVVADRCALALATDRVQAALRSAGATDPHADIRGTPFLTGVLRGHLDDVDVSIPAVRGGTVCLRDLRAHLSGGRTSLWTVLTGRKGVTTLGHLRATGTLRYDDLQDALRSSTLGLVTVTGDVDGMVLATGGQRLPIVVDTASGRLRLGGGLGLVASLLPGGLTLPVPGLPAGVRVTGVTYTPTGADFTAIGTDVRIDTKRLTAARPCP